MKNIHNTFISIILCSITSLLYSSQQPQTAIVIKNATKQQLNTLGKMTETVFKEDFKPIIESGYKNNPIITSGQLDKFLAEYVALRKWGYESAIENNHDDHQIVVACDKNTQEICGLCDFEKQTNQWDSTTKRVYIHFIATNKKSRQRGIGTALLNHALEAYKNDTDVTMCELTTLAYANDATQKFYEKRDFCNKGLVTIDPRTPDTHFLYQKKLD